MADISGPERLSNRTNHVSTSATHRVGFCASWQQRKLAGRHSPFGHIISTLSHSRNSTSLNTACLAEKQRLWILQSGVNWSWIEPTTSDTQGEHGTLRPPWQKKLEAMIVIMDNRRSIRVYYPLLHTLHLQVCKNIVFLWTSKRVSFTLYKLKWVLNKSSSFVFRRIFRECCQ